MPTTVTLDHLRSYAVACNLFRPASPLRVVNRLGYVQHGPIRAPARAQALIRWRVWPPRRPPAAPL